MLAVCTGSLAHATSVFINEIHYDNAGVDTGEAIEIAGPAGTDLSGWSLVLYNGNGGAVYDTTVLGSVLPDINGSGFGVTTVTYLTNGLQNGSPDGIALVDATSTVKQFLSYEGAFTAVGGPANGVTSTNIGVFEGGATSAGFSLQLTGTGQTYEDFSWTGPIQDTFDAFNFGQTLVAAPASPSGVFFSEYVEGSSFNKALEIFNGTGSAVDLAAENYRIEVYFNGSSLPGTTIALTGLIANNDVFVIGEDSADAAILAIADQLTDASLFNGDDAIALFKGTALVDVIGQIGFDPGSEWGSGLTSTQNNTLRRKSSVTSGDSDGSDPFDPTIEWEGFAQNTFDGLGTHSVAMQTVPEPDLLMLIGIGLAGMWRARRGDETA